MRIHRGLVRAGQVCVVVLALAGCSTVVTGSAVPVPGAPATPRSPGPSSSNPSAAPPASVPGWQVVLATNAGLAYDVPPDWKVATPDTVIGFTDQQGKQVVGMSDSASYKVGYCQGHSGSSRGGVGVNSTNTTDPGQAASDSAQKWANAGYISEVDVPPTITAGTPQPVTVAGVAGMLVRDTLTVAQHSPCDPPTAEVDVLALPLSAPNTGCDQLILYADQGTPDSAPAQELQQIIGSLRAA
ncbi:MAG TPA: hypothetical protein VGJ45_07310 [Pseudonocardiaceae bacterium]|jgi:hypothetical protein